MVLLQDIPFESRQLSNEKRNLEIQLNIVNAAAARGQFKGSPSPCEQAFRSGSQDCGVWQSVQSLPTGPQLILSIQAIQLQIDDLIQQQIEDTTPINEIPIMDEVIQVTPQQNNTLRNALIIGGLILLI